MQADLTPTQNSGQWEKNPALVIGDISSVLHPKNDVEVEVKPKEAAFGKWTLKMGESMTRITLASG
ncbi:hypothetical protein RRF57_013297 [Xylaria bambusicola]|uniref:Uncharacterized protein n=1 Tax=Xylaria bambusicola TaxID=326684 RepID=A0AAN7ZBD0_9PEZI